MVKFYSRKYFKSFLDEYMTLENAHEVYEIFEVLGTGEEPLFKNCCKLLGITRDKFLDGFKCLAELSRIDEDYGLTELALAEKFGKLNYYEDEDLDESAKLGYEMVESTEVDKANPEYIEFCQQLYFATAYDLVESYVEKDFHDDTLLSIVQKIGAFHERKKNIYRLTSEYLSEIEISMRQHGVQNAFDEMGKPTVEFFDKFNTYFCSLDKYEQEQLLTMLGTAKELIFVAEKAGHDCL